MEEKISVTFESRKTYIALVPKSIVMGDDELFADYLNGVIDQGDYGLPDSDGDMIVITDLNEVHFE